MAPAFMKYPFESLFNLSQWLVHQKASIFSPKYLCKLETPSAPRATTAYELMRTWPAVSNGWSDAHARQTP